MYLIDFADPLRSRGIVGSVKDERIKGDHNRMEYREYYDEIVDFKRVLVLVALALGKAHLESGMVQPGEGIEGEADEYFGDLPFKVIIQLLDYLHAGIPHLLDDQPQKHCIKAKVPSRQCRI